MLHFCSSSKCQVQQNESLIDVTIQALSGFSQEMKGSQWWKKVMHHHQSVLSWHLSPNATKKMVSIFAAKIIPLNRATFSRPKTSRIKAPKGKRLRELSFNVPTLNFYSSGHLWLWTIDDLKNIHNYIFANLECHYSWRFCQICVSNNQLKYCAEFFQLVSSFAWLIGLWWESIHYNSPQFHCFLYALPTLLRNSRKINWWHSEINERHMVVPRCTY